VIARNALRDDGDLSPECASVYWRAPVRIVSGSFDGGPPVFDLFDETPTEQGGHVGRWWSLKDALRGAVAMLEDRAEICRTVACHAAGTPQGAGAMAEAEACEALAAAICQDVTQAEEA
jgi:hypothetical protein